MSTAESEWPGLLREYESAIAEFERVSRALTSALTERSATDDDFRALLVAEERARETVVLARMRLINLWRESGAELRRRGIPLPRAFDPSASSRDPSSD
jgi:hypothetical protein